MQNALGSTFVTTNLIVLAQLFKKEIEWFKS